MMAWPHSWLLRIMDSTASYLRCISASLNIYSEVSICRGGPAQYSTVQYQAHGAKSGGRLGRRRREHAVQVSSHAVAGQRLLLLC